VKEEEDEDDEENTDIDENLLRKFVDVTDLFPPLPSKGTFNVDDIQQSRYFFS
jgi:DNA-directed RNA polymerase